MVTTTAGASLLLTGATSGLGLQLARRLAGSTEWTVLATARSEQRVDELRRLLGDPVNFRYAVCDQADLTSIRQAGQVLSGLLTSGEIPPLHSVVLNAGIQSGSTAGATTDGYEVTFATNVIGPHLLLGLLSPHIQSHSRIVQIGSGTHYGQFRRSYGMVTKPRWDSPDKLAAPRTGDGIEAYSTSKLGTLYSTHELARRAPEGTIPICYDPGMLPGTGLARDRNALERFSWRFILPAMRIVPGVSTPARSAAHLASFATGTSGFPERELRAAYVEIDHPVPSSPQSYDEARELELFEYLNTAVGLTDTQAAPWWFKRTG